MINKLYISILKIYGLRGFISKHDNLDEAILENIRENNNSVEIEIIGNSLQQTTKTRRKIYQSTIIRYILNSIYHMFVFLVCIWPCIYGLTKSCIELNLNYLYSIMYSFMFTIQYVVGLKYYYSKYFLNNKNKNNNMIKYLIMLHMISFVITLLIMTCFILLTIFNVNGGIFNEFYNDSALTGKILILIFMSINIFYSYNIFFVNMMTFTITLSIHVYNLKYFRSKIKNFIDNKNAITLTNIIKELGEIKESHEISVKKLNDIFSTALLIGFIASYFLILNFNTKFISIITYIELAVFLIFVSVHLLVIKMINKYTNSISGCVNSPLFMDIYLKKTASESLKTTIYSENEINNVNNDMFQYIIKAMVKSHENSNSLDWFILNYKLDTEWQGFIIFGYNVNDTDLLKRIVGIITGVLMLMKIGTTFVI